MHARPQVERIVSNAMAMSSASGLEACTVRAVRSGFFLWVTVCGLCAMAVDVHATRTIGGRRCHGAS